MASITWERIARVWLGRSTRAASPEIIDRPRHKSSRRRRLDGSSSCLPPRVLGSGSYPEFQLYIGQRTADARALGALHAAAAAAAAAAGALYVSASTANQDTHIKRRYVNALAPGASSLCSMHGVLLHVHILYWCLYKLLVKCLTIGRLGKYLLVGFIFHSMRSCTI